MNKAILIGYVGAEPEMSTLTSGDSKCRIRLATHSFYKNAEGKRVKRTEWHSVILFKKLAETAEKFLHSGSHISVEGEIRYRQYEKNGVKRDVTEIVADDFQMLDRKPKDENDPQAA